MRRLLPIVACLMLALVLFLGTRAHASEGTGLAGAELLAHFEGDADQAPADEHEPVRHHHGLCHADHIGIAAGSGQSAPISDAEVAPQASTPLDFPSTTISTALRPPIA